MDTNLKDSLRANLYYVIIALLSIGVLIVFPFLHSDLSAGLLFPTTTAGWFLFWFEKLSITGINMTIFTAFKKQGKLNIKDNDKYLEAQKLMNKVKCKAYKPLSPVQYQAKTYGKKGTTLIITTMASLVAITNMLLKFDYLALISYAVTIIMAIIFGIFAMKQDELYWTSDYYYWALQQATAAQISPVSQSNDEVIHATGPNNENLPEGEI